MSLPGIREYSLQQPEVFLRAVGSPALRLDDLALVEMWALVGIAARARADGPAPLAVDWTATTPARGFAQGVGFFEVVQGTSSRGTGAAGRTVRLTRVSEERDIGPASWEIARLMVGDEPTHALAHDTSAYVITELLRNVIQHSEDLLGGVVGAQLNDRGRHADKPVYQVAVADCGRGVRASLSRTHTDVFDDDVALEQALWPYHSGAFSPGQSGGEENAGLGLFYISEMAKALSGRMLIASGGAALVIDPSLPRRIDRLSCGFPGTLVAFGVPVLSSMDFAGLFEDISQLARERSPRRVSRGLVRLDAPPEGTPRFLVNAFLENNEEALRLAREQLIPRMVRGEPVALDFVNVRVITQSFAHALLFEALRFAWAGKSHVFALHAAPVVQSALRHLEMYSQTG